MHVVTEQKDWKDRREVSKWAESLVGDGMSRKRMGKASTWVI